MSCFKANGTCFKETGSYGEMCGASKQMDHMQGDWVVRENVSYLEAGGSYFKGNGEACNTSLRREGQPIQLKKQIR